MTINIPAIFLGAHSLVDLKLNVRVHDTMGRIKLKDVFPYFEKQMVNRKATRLLIQTIKCSTTGCLPSLDTQVFSSVIKRTVVKK